MKKLVIMVAAAVGITLLSPAASTGATTGSVGCLVGRGGAVQCGLSAERSYSYVLVARLYSGKGYTGRVLRIYRTSPCTTSTSTVELALNLAKVYYYGAWDNRVMSFTTHNNCDVRLYDGPDGGYSMPPTWWLDHDADMLIGGRNWQRKVDYIKLS